MIIQMLLQYSPLFTYAAGVYLGLICWSFFFSVIAVVFLNAYLPSMPRFKKAFIGGVESGYLYFAFEWFYRNPVSDMAITYLLTDLVVVILAGLIIGYVFATVRPEPAVKSEPTVKAAEPPKVV